MDIIIEENGLVENTETESSIKRCGDLLETFIKQSKAIRNFTFDGMLHIAHELKETVKKIKAFEFDDEFSYGKFRVADEILSDEEKNTALLRNLPYELVVRVCSLYDTYLSGILREILFDKSMVGLFEKTLSISEIDKFESKEELIKYCIDCKLDEIFRKSRQEQIEWCEKSFHIDITSSYKNWKQLILFFEMRNIIVHNNGVVNRIFLENLNKKGIANEYKIGSELDIKPKVLKEGINQLFIFAIYVFSLSMGKLYDDSEKRAEIDGYIIQATYECLLEKEYTVAISIVDHCLQKNQTHSNSDQLYLTINKCVALKCLKKESYKQIVEKIDWSNCNDLFLLAKYVLIEDYPEAIKYMKKLANDEKMVINYIEWPLFDWFRETKEFHSAFKEIYGIEFEEELSHIVEEKAAAFKHSSEESGDVNGAVNEKLAS